jgi:hypothetical protein
VNRDSAEIDHLANHLGAAMVAVAQTGAEVEGLIEAMSARLDRYAAS